MNQRTTALSQQIKELEKQLREEIQRIRIHTYEIRDKGIHFTDEVLAQHRRQAKKLWRYLREAKLKHVLTAPLIWCCIFPALFLDLVISIYQASCFPVYGIPKVRRADYIVLDRRHLAYLNIIEKANCLFCGYFNGLIAYVGEVAGRTEQYWCPIKHARALKQEHSRYNKFADYGDGDAYCTKVDDLRTDFHDIDSPPD